METNNSYNFDFKKIITIALQNKKGYVITFFSSVVLGLIVGFSVPKTYTTKVMLAPESSSESALGGSLSSLTSLVGINMNGMSVDAIFPEIYPDVVRSTTFLVGLSEIHVQSADKKISTTLYDYIANEQKYPWWLYPIELFDGDDEEAAKKKLNAYRLDEEQAEVIKAINEFITCSVNKTTGVITITATAQDPLISAVLADSVRVRLQDFITDYRTRKARVDLEYYTKLASEAKSEYEKARRLYGSYADANVDLTLTSFKAKEQDLENDMQLKYNAYTTIVTQLQMAKAKVQERTPAFTVIQGASVPQKPAGPKRVLFVLSMMFLTFMGTTVYVFKSFIGKQLTALK